MQKIKGIRKLLGCMTLVLAGGSAFGQASVLEAVRNMENQQYEAAEKKKANEIQRRADEANRRATQAASSFIVSAPGVIKDTRTGLEWMRCNLGSEWSESNQTCERKIVDEFLVQEALGIAAKINAAGGFSGRKDWRLPTVRELSSLILCPLEPNGKVDIRDGKAPLPSGCYDFKHHPETLVAPVFGKNVRSYYWTSTSAKQRENDYFLIDFRSGLIEAGGYGSSDGGHVRLVR